MAEGFEDVEVLEDVKIGKPFDSPSKRGGLFDEVAWDNEIPVVEPFNQHDVPMLEPFIEDETFSDINDSSIEAGDSVNCTSSEEDDDLGIDETFVSTDFEILTESDNESEKLYGSSNLTVLKALGILFSWFCSSPGISKEAFNKLLHILHTFLLPDENYLPNSYVKALAKIKHLLVPVRKYDCCVNDCVVFRNSSVQDNLEEIEVCPSCKESRYKCGSRIARKIFKYIPLGPRLKRMFSDSAMSESLQSHNTSNSIYTIISDIHQSCSWKSMYDINGFFKGDVRGISLSFCTDGMNPFSKEKVVYSMWPIVVSVLNLPRRIRYLPGSMFLVGIVPGRNEPKNMDPYLDILVDEILELNGSSFYDGYRNEQFALKIDIMLNVLDYPGHNKIFHCHGAGAYAGCAYCTQIGEYSKPLQKIVYLDNRCFLTKTDVLRNDLVNFPSKKSESKSPPELKTTAYVDAANQAYDKAVSQNKKRKLAQENGCKGSYSFRRLPFHDRTLNTPVDPMHLVKDIIEHCIKLVTGVEDSHKVRREEQIRGRFRSSWVKENQVANLPPAPFILTSENKVLADKRAKSILVPASFDWRPREIFSKTGGMKAHEWKQVATNGILKFCLRGMLAQKQRQTLFALFDVIKEICVEDIDMDTINETEQSVHRALALIERDFPVSMQVIVFHLLHHLPKYVNLFGPVYSFWMFPYERFNSWISRRILNRRYPEATVLETYRLTEWAHFMEVTKQLPEGATGVLSDPEDDGRCDSNDSFVLTDEQLSDLHSNYMSLIAEYNQLIQLYERERDRAKTYHCIKSFPSRNQWQPENFQTLTEIQKEMLVGPSAIVFRLDHFSYHDSHGRQIKLRSIESERDYLNTRCSYVSTCDDNVLKVGQILTIFQHTFLSSTTTFVYVSWFEDIFRDSETNLTYVFTSTQTQAITPVSTLSQPLAVSFDENEPGKLWILNL